MHKLFERITSIPISEVDVGAALADVLDLCRRYERIILHSCSFSLSSSSSSFFFFFFAFVFLLVSCCRPNTSFFLKILNSFFHDDCFLRSLILRGHVRLESNFASLVASTIVVEGLSRQLDGHFNIIQASSLSL